MKRYDLNLSAKPEPAMVPCDDGDFILWDDYQAGTCKMCGQSLPSNGECNGCRVDRLREAKVKKVGVSLSAVVRDFDCTNPEAALRKLRVLLAEIGGSNG